MGTAGPVPKPVFLIIEASLVHMFLILQLSIYHSHSCFIQVCNLCRRTVRNATGSMSAMTFCPYRCSKCHCPLTLAEINSHSVNLCTKAKSNMSFELRMAAVSVPVNQCLTRLDWCDLLPGLQPGFMPLPAVYCTCIERSHEKVLSL